MRWAELVILYLGFPIALIYTEDIFPLIPTLLIIVGCALIALRVQGWQYRALFMWGSKHDWMQMLGTFFVSVPVVLLVAYIALPGDWLAFPQEELALWALVMMLYPIFSALPQEIMYRAYFFYRFTALFGGRPQVMVVVSAVLFAFGHIMFMHWITLAFTFVGGLLFAWRYARTGSVLLAAVEHGLYGNLLFTAGFGQFIFSGAV